MFDEIVFSRSLPEMVRAGHLARIAGWRVETDVDLTRVKTKMGDHVASQLSEAVNVGARNDVVVGAHQRLCAGRPTLCFCVDVAHAESLARAFSARGTRAASVTGEMSREARADALALA